MHVMATKKSLKVVEKQKLNIGFIILPENAELIL
jgi:hypothetical protein